MRKLLLVGALAAMLVSFASFAFAGDYHSGGTLNCAECHIMHGSMRHAYDGTPGDPYPLAPGGPFRFLLRAQPNDLCLQCHDGRGADGIPDVLNANSRAGLRSAGALNRLGSTDPDYSNWTGHTLDSMDAPPGVGTTVPAHGLECVDCHHQHGSTRSGRDINGVSVTSAYRNINTLGGLTISYYTSATNTDLTKDVWQRVNTFGDSAHYEPSNVDYNETNLADAGYGTWCQKCHISFHATSGTVAGVGGTVEWIRHPTANANIGAIGGGHSNLNIWKTGDRNGTPVVPKTNFVKVLSENGIFDANAINPTPSCMSCHKSHGNKNAFGLVYMRGTGIATEEGDDGTQARDLCHQCHVQAV